MEHKIGSIITYNKKGKPVYLKVIPVENYECQECYFYNHIDPCTFLKDVIGYCTKYDREDKQYVIFKQIKDNIMKKKTTIDIYSVMQTHTQYRCFCEVFTSFEEADARFKELLKYFKELNKVQPRGWTTETIPSQIKVSVIEDTTLYLCKETKEVEIEIEDTSTDNGDSMASIRHFYNKKECIDEMSKFSPFGVLYNKSHKRYVTVLEITDEGITIMSANHEIATISFFSAKSYFTFLDNSPFGISRKAKLLYR